MRVTLNFLDLPKIGFDEESGSAGGALSRSRLNREGTMAHDPRGGLLEELGTASGRRLRWRPEALMFRLFLQTALRRGFRCRDTPASAPRSVAGS